MTSPLFDLTGKKAIFGGGSGDLGRAMVKGLRDAGVQVVILGRSDDLDHIAQSLSESSDSPSEHKPRVIGVRTNLADRVDLKRGFEEALKILGTVDILVNAQGIQRRYPAEDFPLEVWDQVIEINLTSVFELCQLAGRVMIQKGRGKIINIASMNSYTGGITIPAYAASKAGVALLTKALCNEWSSKGVNVNAIAPGYIDTKMTAALKADPVRNPQTLARIPMGRWGKPEDLVGPLLFLASPASDYLAGIILPVDGGWLAR